MSERRRGNAELGGFSRSAVVRWWRRWAAASLNGAFVLGMGGLFVFSELHPALEVAVAIIQTVAVILLACGVLAAIGGLAAARLAESSRVLAPLVAARERSAAARPVDESAAWVRRTVCSELLALMILGAVVLGILHIAVWNPLAKAPGHSLDEIYAAIAAAGRLAGTHVLVLWAFACILVALALPFLCQLARLTPRFTLIFGLLSLGATTLGGWYPAAAMSFNLAAIPITDGFGGDAAVSGPVLALAGLVAIAAGLIMSLSPPAAKHQVVTVNDLALR